MAEYYPLLAKAVSGLPEPTREARHALYERARNALLNQLRNIQPPVAESDIERESQALASAAARLETEFDARSVVGGAIRPEALRSSPAPTAPPAARGLAGTKPPAPSPSYPAARPSPAAPQPRRTGAAEFITAPSPAGSVPPPKPGRTAPSILEPADYASPAAAAATPGPQTSSSIAPNPDVVARSDEPAAALSLRLRPEMARPYAPQPAVVEEQPHMRRRLWLVAAVVALVVVLIAVAAVKLANRPEDLMRLKPGAQTQAELGGGKIVERIGGQKTQDSPRTTTAAAAPAGGVARTRDAEPAPLPVAQRAALLVEAPEEQARVKTYVGTVVWRLDNVSNGSGQPLSTAVRADVDIPEAKLRASIIFQKNFDASLSASHTITIIFTPAPDSLVGSVKEIRIPQLRAIDSQTGDALNGIPVPIMENSFLVGLSRGGAEAMNLDLIKRRDWIDIPMILQANGRIAKLTFEKNTTGARAIEDALASWQAQ
jgi:hypothetical protein